MPENNIQESVDSSHQGALNEFEASFNYSSIGIVITNAKGGLLILIIYSNSIWLHKRRSYCKDC